jgi:hypothetical protein
MKKLLAILIEKYSLFVLILYSLLTKLVLIWKGNIPFTFDHGKDSMAILHMIKTLSPKLIGPWTSISGLYFGPGWYYLLAPGYLLTNGNPISAVYTMIGLNLIMVYLVYKYFGKLPALFIATAPIWTVISTSAWNPFPMPLLMLIILINLKKQSLSNKNIFLIALSASFSFHFSSAYAVFYLLIIPLIVILRKVCFGQKFTKGFFISAFAGFVLPFMPQLLFELRHSFVETKAIIAYLTNPPTSKISKDFITVLRETWGELGLAIFPEINGLQTFVLLLFLSVLCFGIYKISKGAKFDFKLEWLLFIIIPLIFFPQLHFNFWYSYAMLPIAVLLFANLLRKSPKFLQIIYATLLVITPLYKIHTYNTSTSQEISESRQALPIKVKAVNRIYELAGGNSFSSYHYVPDIYDFSYQYIYFWNGFRGRTLPYEFSYEPGKIDYVKEKPDLLTKVKTYKEDPKYIFFVVEKPESEQLLEEWWNRNSNYKKIIHEETLSDTVKLY